MSHEFETDINKRLLFSDEPLEDEGMVSYLRRLASINEILDMRWIYKSVLAQKTSKYVYHREFDEKIDLERLSILTGVTTAKLEKLNYNLPSRPIITKIELTDLTVKPGWCRSTVRGIPIDPSDWTQWDRYIKWVRPVDKFGEPNCQEWIKREQPKICTVCLKENIYCRKIWDLTLVTTCPHHRCRLINKCPNCGEHLSWERPALNICQCGYDYREFNPATLKKKETRLAAYLHREFGLSCCRRKKAFKEPFNSLGWFGLMKLVLFVISHLTGDDYFSGYKLSKYAKYDYIHACLSLGVETFDNWPRNYHEFVKRFRGRMMDNYFLTSRHDNLHPLMLPDEYQQYELFNQMQHVIFYEDYFSFIHEELLNLLNSSYTKTGWSKK